MNDALLSLTNDCRSCYKCIRACPNKAIAFSDGRASIIPEDCVYCGRCFSICPQGCKKIRDDTSLASSLLKEGNCYASLAPSFISSFPGVGLEGMEEGLRKLGFIGVEETARGAKTVKEEYERLLEESPDILISSCCPSLNLLIQKRFPSLLPYLAKVPSPMEAHARMLKKEHPGCKVIFIGPCIAKKVEADTDSNGPDCVLTFLELEELLSRHKVSLSPLGEKKQSHSLTRLFPSEGGIISSMKRRKEGYSYLALSGSTHCMEALEEASSGKIHRAFLELSMCPGSCLGGPAASKGHCGPLQSLVDLRNFAGNEDFQTAALSSKDLIKDFPNLHRESRQISEEEIEEVLRQIGKASKKDELNCSCCGYPSCREKAKAVILGKANLEMCLPYLSEKAVSLGSDVVEYSPNGILVLNEDCIIQLSNPAMAGLLKVGSPSALIGHNVSDFIDPELFCLALSGQSTHLRKMELSNGRIAEATIHYDQKYHIIIASLRDVTDHEMRKKRHLEDAERTAKVTSEVIEKNMETVQQIAQLLGESAASTKIALTALSNALKEKKGGGDGAK